MKIRDVNPSTSIRDLGLSRQMERFFRHYSPSDIVRAARQGRLTEFDGVGEIRAAVITESLVASGYVAENPA